ncbi:dephospho-CoA kinase [Azovibrio restrictus]|uniref:dephospho-CoA kinase n=1 Tax=Azovibrio restrictus TaxID=146938 RepID=UPI0026F19342|nr:dephospho-CoA kinase [Azovibrio restrictus]
MSFVVGLTGGIGSGKSTVAEAFVALGAGLVDTDVLARQLTSPGGAAMAALVDRFGAGIRAADGSLDRAAMRQRVFADPEARRALEAILHPLIRRQAEADIAALGAPYVLLAIPLLVETGRESYCLDRVLVVDCPEALQRSRVMARNGLSAAEVEAIMAAQASRAARLAVADDVLDNSGRPGDLAGPVAQLHRRYLQLARVKECAGSGAAYS